MGISLQIFVKYQSFVWCDNGGYWRRGRSFRRGFTNSKVYKQHIFRTILCWQSSRRDSVPFSVGMTMCS